MKVGIVGATGAVGEELVKVLEARRDALQVQQVRLFASERSAGKVFNTSKFGALTIEEYSLEAVSALDVVFLAVSGSFALENAKLIAAAGPLVIDNSSAFRNDPDIPLVIPEINAHTLKGHRLIANPNCTTATAAMALWPLHCKFGIKKLIMSTYQAASGAGAEGMSELEGQARAWTHKKPLESSVFAYPLMFNIIPHIDTFQENGYTREEMKVCWETRKIFGIPSLDVSCTAVRIPTLRAHAEAITVETWEPITPEAARRVIDMADGVELVDDVSSKKYPMPLNASGKYDVEAGRIRNNLIFKGHGLDLFVCGDQLLRGAALNAVLIAEYYSKSRFESVPPFKPSIRAQLAAKVVDIPTALVVAGVAGALGAACTAVLMRRS